jgi:hypothetical protein
MILSQDKEKWHIIVSTKKLEFTLGDMLCCWAFVYHKVH